MTKEPTMAEVQQAVDEAIRAGHIKAAKVALIAAGWVPVPSRWRRCKPENPGDREYVIDECRRAIEGE